MMIMWYVMIPPTHIYIYNFFLNYVVLVQDSNEMILRTNGEHCGDVSLTSNDHLAPAAKNQITSSYILDFSIKKKIKNISHL